MQAEMQAERASTGVQLEFTYELLERHAGSCFTCGHFAAEDYVPYGSEPVDPCPRGRGRGEGEQQGEVEDGDGEGEGGARKARRFMEEGGDDSGCRRNMGGGRGQGD